jgi:hypothetical protein
MTQPTMQGGFLQMVMQMVREAMGGAGGGGVQRTAGPGGPVQPAIGGGRQGGGAMSRILPAIGRSVKHGTGRPYEHGAPAGQGWMREALAAALSAGADSKVYGQQAALRDARERRLAVQRGQAPDPAEAARDAAYQGYLQKRLRDLMADPNRDQAEVDAVRAAIAGRPAIRQTREPKGPSRRSTRVNANRERWLSLSPEIRKRLTAMKVGKVDTRLPREQPALVAWHAEAGKDLYQMLDGESPEEFAEWEATRDDFTEPVLVEKAKTSPDVDEMPPEAEPEPIPAAARPLWDQMEELWPPLR